MEVNNRPKGKIRSVQSTIRQAFSVPPASENNDEERDFEPSGPKLNLSFSVNKLVCLFDKFSDEKLELVGEIGFGALTNLKKQDRFNRQLAFWLLLNMDHGNGTIILKNGSKLRLNDFDIHVVLGLPCSGDRIPVSGSCSQKDVDRVHCILMIGQAKESTLDYLEHLLLREYAGRMNANERRAFKVALLLYVDAYFLSPRSYPPKANQNLYSHIVQSTSIRNKNWSAYVFDGLKNSSYKVQQSVKNRNRSSVLDGYLFALKDSSFFLKKADRAQRRNQ